MTDPVQPAAVARIEGLEIQNYRSLRDVKFDHLCPLTTLLGPNGSGKSTIFDVFAFLAECFGVGLRKAWDRRGRFRELRSREARGPIVFEVKYRERPHAPLTYHLEVDEDPKGPFVCREWLRWTRGGRAGRPFVFLDFNSGEGFVISGDEPEETDERILEKLESRELLAVNTLGQFAKHPRVSALRRFISGWHLSYLTADSTRGQPEAGPQERLSQTGDNLPNVIQYLKEGHPDQLERIFETLRKRVPRLEKVDAELLADGRLLLQIKDAPFARPILAKWASDGTLKLLAYLVALYDPTPPPLIGIEEPENHLHPRLLPELAEECRGASERSQLIVTTHSPFFIDAMRPGEVWMLYRDEEGFTRVNRIADIQGVAEFVETGAKLGQLWMEGHFRVGDPLTRSGEPASPLSNNPSAARGKRR
jgi:predicted ATPase